MKRTIVILAIILVAFSSCTHYFTPAQAAARGGMSCSRHNSIR